MINPRPRTYRYRAGEPGPFSADADILELIGAGKRVLELGNSRGQLTRLLSEQNCSVTTIEADAAVAAEASAFSGEVIVADLDVRSVADLLPRKSFDVALFADVLAHLRDPWKVLDEARSFLHAGSFAVISLPNIAHASARLSLLHGKFEYAPDGLFDAAHLRFFTLRSVRELCLRAGYRIDEVRRTKADIFENPDLFPDLDASTLSEKAVAQIRRDPEHDTVYFILRATPLDDHEKFSRTVSALIAAEDAAVRLEQERDSLEAQRDSFRARAEELQGELNTLLSGSKSAEAEIARLERELSATEDARAALRETTLTQLAAADSKRSADLEFLRQSLQSQIKTLERSLVAPHSMGADRGGDDVSNQGYNTRALDDLRFRESEIDRLNLVERLQVERARKLTDGGYKKWRLRHAVRGTDIPRLRELSKLLPRRPLISVAVATYETPEPFLRQALESVRNQAYPYWQLCVADDASKAPHVRAVLEEYAALDARIRVVYRTENGHISAASNSALELAEGEFIGFLDHDDLLTPDALLEVALAVNHRPDVDMLYSDEDKLDPAGRHTEPHFKPDWCPDSYLSRNYTCHFGVYRRTLVEQLGGLRAGFEGSQDYDLVLRLTERTDRIVHIPKVLYHWRMHGGSTAGLTEAKPYAFDAALLALNEALERRGESGRAEINPEVPSIYRIRYEIKEPRRVSVVVATRDSGERADRCLQALFANANYPDLEVVLVDNGTTEPSSLERLERWEHDPRVRVLRCAATSNQARVLNYGASESSGHYLMFLDEHVELFTPETVKAMVEQAQRPSIGAVGGLLLSPDDTVRHAGIIVGLHGVAGYAFRGLQSLEPGYCSMAKALDNYSAVSGACMMVRKQDFERLGAFSEIFAGTLYDVDLCLKMRAAGLRTVYLSHVAGYDFAPASARFEGDPEGFRRFEPEVSAMKKRWNTMEFLDPCYNPNLSRDFEDFRVCSETERWAAVIESNSLGLAAAQ